MHTNNGQESSLTLLEGTPVVDAGGQMRGRVADVVVGTGAEAGRVLSLVVKSPRGREHIDVQALSLTEAGGLMMAAGAERRPPIRMRMRCCFGRTCWIARSSTCTGARLSV